MTALALVLALVQASETAAAAKPRARQEEKQPVPAPPQERLPRELRLEDESGGLLDFEWLELQARVGIAVFSDTFRIDPSPQISLLLHAPMPWLSPSSDPGGDYFGAFVELTVVPGAERDLDPPPNGTSGTILLVNLGIDFTLLRNQSLLALLRAGGQYASYGGIADLNDGFAPLAGAELGVYLGGGLTLALAGEAAFVDDGDTILLGSLGLVIEF